MCLVACGPKDDGEAVVFDDVTVTVSEDVATVLTVTWRTSEPVRSHAVFGVQGEPVRSTPDTPEGTEHEVVLLGLPADAEIALHLVAGADESEPVFDVATGSLPAEVPTVVPTGEAFDSFLLTSSTGTVNWVLMFDPQGRVVWYHRDDRGLSVFRARATRDGAGVVYSSVLNAGFASPDSEIVRVPWTGGAGEAVGVADLAHDFVELADGTIVSLASEFREAVEGSELLAIDASGTATQLWSTWDCFDPVTNAGDDPARGWTHANALDYDEASGDYLVGMRNLATIARVDTATRTCPWGFGGTGGTVDIDGTRFIHEHQFDLIDGGMLVFDNDGAAGNVSRVIEYTFDEDALTASELRTFTADPPLYSFIMGDVHRAPDDSTIILWSTPMMIDRLDPDGVRIGRLEVVADGPLGFVERILDPAFAGP